MKRILGCLLIVAGCICLPAKPTSAQTHMRLETVLLRADSAGTSRGAANAYLAQELAELQREMSFPRSGGGLTEDLLKRWLDAMTSLRDVYKDNPYVRITGFALNVAIPPSVSVNVDFR